MRKTMTVLIAAMLCGIATTTMAQTSGRDARFAEIRKCYANAQKMAEAATKGPKKNYIHIDQHTNDPESGYLLRKIDFFFDNSELSPELQFYPCKLVFVRDAGNDYYEYLFDKQTEKLMFYYRRIKSENQINELRIYYPKDDEPAWKIEKITDANTKKVLEEKEERDESGDAVWALREATALTQAFNGVTAVFE